MPFRGMWYYRFICYSTCFFVNYIFGDIFYYQYYNYCNCAILVLVLLLFFQDSRCIVNVSNKKKKNQMTSKESNCLFSQLKQLRLMMIVCSIIRDQCSHVEVNVRLITLLCQCLLPNESICLLLLITINSYSTHRGAAYNKVQ